jgi:fatty acid desaturase
MSKDDNLVLDKQVIKQLSERSNYKGLVQLAGHLTILILTTAALAQAQGSAWVLPALLGQAIVLTFLFAPLHETIHFTAFRTGWLNNIVAAFIGFIQLLPYQYFRCFHYAHHRHTQNPQFDPELIDKKPCTRKTWIWHISGLPIWQSNIRSIYRHAMGIVDEVYLQQKDHRKIITEARWHAAGYLTILLFSLIFANDWFWWYWLLPSLFGQPFLRLFLLAEHNGCDLSDNMLENSRTTYTAPLLNFLAWNMPYHAEHHYLASIPFHALPALHAWTGQQVKHKGAGYRQVNQEIFSILKNQ